jgi:hypothetical protein
VGSRLFQQVPLNASANSLDPWGAFKRLFGLRLLPQFIGLRFILLLHFRGEDLVSFAYDRAAFYGIDFGVFIQSLLLAVSSNQSVDSLGVVVRPDIGNVDTTSRLSVRLFLVSAFVGVVEIVIALLE